MSKINANQLDLTPQFVADGTNDSQLTISGNAISTADIGIRMVEEVFAASEFVLDSGDSEKTLLETASLDSHLIEGSILLCNGVLLKRVASLPEDDEWALEADRIVVGGDITATGNIYTIKYWISEAAPGGVSSISPSQIAVRVRRSTSWTVTNTAAAISFNTEEFDTDNMWDSGAPTRLTANTAGYYLVGGNLSVLVGANNYFASVSLQKNGSTFAVERMPPAGTATVKMFFLCPQRVVYLEANDYVEMIAQTTGSVTTDPATYGQYSSGFWAIRISDDKID